MHNQLAPALGSKGGSQLPSAETPSVIRLAEEYCTVFGRPALDAIIREFVPTSRYTAGSLHERLVAMPWKDILTTNWDTLIETAADQSQPHRYTVVAAARDIPYAKTPRIVKLHGCVLRNQNFTLTEEDFRTYESRQKPFVNLVRQSMIENTTCLIGFSGEDPNFLNWSGWRRDMLGADAPPVFLVDLIDVTQARLKLLDQLNIRLIDLRGLIPEISTDSRSAFSVALGRFFCLLEGGRPYNLNSWLGDATDTAAATGDLAEKSAANFNPADILDFPVRPVKEPTYLEHPPNDDKWKTQQDAEIADWFCAELETVTEKWIHNRALYPGWVVAPTLQRNMLLQQTRSWVDAIDKAPSPGGAADKSAPLKKLRARHSLSEGDRNTSAKISKALCIDDNVLLSCDGRRGAKIAIFVDEALWRYDVSLHRRPDWLNSLIFRLLSNERSSVSDPQAPWLERRLAFAALSEHTNADEARMRMFRIARAWLVHLRRKRKFMSQDNQTNPLDSHTDLTNALRESLSGLPTEFEAGLDHEINLRHIIRGKFNIALIRLREPTPVNTDPYHLIRQASLLAELRHFEEALGHCDEALRRIRMQRQLNTDDIAIRSRENWAMYVRRLIMQDSEVSRYANTISTSGNADQTGAEAAFIETDDSRYNPERECRGLDILRVAMLYGADQRMVEQLNIPSPAFATYQAFEAAGVPIIGSITHDLSEAARLLIEEDHSLAVSCFIRCRNILFRENPESDSRQRRSLRSAPLSSQERRRLAELTSRSATPLCKQLTEDIKTLLVSRKECSPKLESLIFERISNQLHILSDLIDRIQPHELDLALDSVGEVYEQLIHDRPTDVGIGLQRALFRAYELVRTPAAAKHAPSLIKFALKAVCFDVARAHTRTWPEPLRFFPSQRLSEMIKAGLIKQPKTDNVPGLPQSIMRLHENAVTSDALARNASLHRLNMLCLLGLHDPNKPVSSTNRRGRSYTELAADAFDDMKSSPDFNPCRWLGLRPPENRRSKKAQLAFKSVEDQFLQEYVRLDADTRRLEWKTLFNIASATTAFDSPPGSSPPLLLSKDDAESLTYAILSWTSQFLAEEQTLPDGGEQELLSWIIAQTLLPVVGINVRTQLIERTLDLHSMGFPVDRAFGEIVLHNPPEGLADRLETSLRSSDPVRCRSAIEGILHWVSLAKDESASSLPPSRLVVELFSLIEGPNEDMAHLAFSCIAQWAELPFKNIQGHNQIDKFESIITYLERLTENADDTEPFQQIEKIVILIDSLKPNSKIEQRKIKKIKQALEHHRSQNRE